MMMMTTIPRPPINIRSKVKVTGSQSAERHNVASRQPCGAVSLRLSCRATRRSMDVCIIIYYTDVHWRSHTAVALSYWMKAINWPAWVCTFIECPVYLFIYWGIGTAPVLEGRGPTRSPLKLHLCIFGLQHSVPIQVLLKSHEETHLGTF